MKFSIIFFLSSVLLFHSDTPEFNNYSNVVCKGEIPSIFIGGLNNYVKLQEDLYKDYFKEDEKLDKLKEKLILGSGLNQDYYFKSGLILFGDPITNYLNKIKNQLLKGRTDLLHKVNIFVLKSSEVNAYSSLDGNVYVTLGLISRVKSEAELAFVLSHEIAHYILHHSMDQLKTTKEVEDLTRLRKKLTLDDVLKFKLQRNRGQEFEADSVGLEIFNKSTYKNKDAIEVLTCLATAHLPIKNQSFDTRYFDSHFFIIPNSFFKEELKEAKARENLNDELSTHPDIKRRKEKIINFLKKEGEHGEHFINDKSEFENIRMIAAFEVVQRLLVNRNYGEVIYLSYNLLEKYPQSEYLHISIAKALYAASMYKNSQQYHFAASSYSRIEGESQQIHYMLKHLSAVQLNTLALKQVLMLKKNYPGNGNLPLMETRLVEDLVLKHKQKLEDFFSRSEAEEQLKETYNLAKKDTSASKLDLRLKYKQFYLLALAEDKEDPLLKEKFSHAYAKLEQEERFKSMTYQERERLNKEKEKLKLKIGWQINASDIIIFEPEYFKFEKELIKSLEGTETEKKEFIDQLKLKIQEYNKNIKLLSASELKRSDTEIYTEYSTVANWIQERENHLAKVNIAPLYAESLKANLSLNSFRYICTIDIIKFKNSYFSYLFNFYDVETGEKVYSTFKYIDQNIRMNKLMTFISADFENVIK